MSDPERKNGSSEAMEQILGNMSVELQNGQYTPLGFPLNSAPQEPLNWPQQPAYAAANYPLSYNQEVPPNPMFAPLNSQYGFISEHVENNYDYANNFNKCNYFLNHNNEMGGGGDCGGYPQHGGLTFINSNLGNVPKPVEVIPSTAAKPLIENLAENWRPNNTGHYSPFGNSEPFKRSSSMCNVFNKLTQPSDQLIDEQIKSFHTTSQSSSKKPRMVAEVKPMRPTYSDILAKSVPPVAKVPKNDTTDKAKKGEARKMSKINPTSSTKSTPLNRNTCAGNTTNPKGTDKTTKVNCSHHQLSRKWASLDQINDSSNCTTSPKFDDKKKQSDGDFVSTSATNVTNTKSAGKSGKSAAPKNNNSDVSPDFNHESTAQSDPCLIKNGIKKIMKSNKRNSDVSFDRPPGNKRSQRVKKKESNVVLNFVRQKMKHYLKKWWKLVTVFLFWLFNLISDVCTLSVHIGRDMAVNLWQWLNIHWALFLDTSLTIIKRFKFLTWIWEKFKKSEDQSSSSSSKDGTGGTNNNKFLHSGLRNNINMPTTGEEAMKRLQACKGKDPYSILGVTPACTDDDIKRYYKKQAFLVHPDKNQQPGAEEAFKILVHAFDMIGEPERRASYDKGVVESVQVEQAWSELTELLVQLQQKVEAAANTIRCSACGQRHKRIKTERPGYAARNCASCKIHHAAREGDIWAEARCWGFLWHYYACMEGGVYDITEWAACQRYSLKHLKPDTHQVQYRIALGKQGQPRRHSGSPRSEKPPDLDNLLNTLYGQGEQPQGTGGGAHQGAKQRKKKTK